MRPRHPLLAPVEVATGLGLEQVPQGLIERGHLGSFSDPVLTGVPAGIVDHLADAHVFSERILLGLRTGPLGEAAAVVPTGVPGPGADQDLTVDTMLVQIVRDEGGCDAGGTGPYPFQQGQIEGGPVIGPFGHIAKPTPVFTVGAGGHQGWEVAPLGTFGDLGDEPLQFHPGLLGIREVPVADDDGDGVVPIAGQVRAVA